jgi:hypothetical protein
MRRPSWCVDVQVQLLQFHDIPFISAPGHEPDGLNTLYRKHCTSSIEIGDETRRITRMDTSFAKTGRKSGEGVVRETDATEFEASRTRNCNTRQPKYEACPAVAPPTPPKYTGPRMVYVDTVLSPTPCVFDNSSTRSRDATLAEPDPGAIDTGNSLHVPVRSGTVALLCRCLADLLLILLGAPHRSTRT